jgi:hypothetical protein
MVEKCPTLSGVGVGASELYEMSSNAFWLEEVVETLDLGCNDVAEVIRRLEERPRVRVVPSMWRGVFIMQIGGWSVAVNRIRDVAVIEGPNYALIADEHFLLLIKCGQKYIPVGKARKVRIACTDAKEYSPFDIRTVVKGVLRNELARAILH